MRNIPLLLSVQGIGASIVTRLKVFSIFLLKWSISIRRHTAVPMTSKILLYRVMPVTCSSRTLTLALTQKGKPRSLCFIHVATHGTCILLSMLTTGNSLAAHRLVEQP
jgi:hypothetical protein